MNKINLFHMTEARQDQVLQEYVVRPGDTLYRIALKHGVSVDDLMNANALLSNLIFPNQVIVIPQRGEFGAVYFEEYVIQPNDTLQLIAENVGVSVNDITRYNDISKLMLEENQTLKIPRNYVHYTIQPGDTAESILSDTGMTAMELLIANKGRWLAPGMTINVQKKSS